MIEYCNGDILDSGADLICHQVNCQGAFGRGMAGAIRQRFPESVVHSRITGMAAQLMP